MWEGGHGESLESGRVLHGQKEDGEELGTFYCKDNKDHLLWTVFHSIGIFFKNEHTQLIRLQNGTTTLEACQFLLQNF